MACVTDGVGLGVGCCIQHQRSVALKCTLLCMSFKSALRCQTQYHTVLLSVRGVAGFDTLFIPNRGAVPRCTQADTSAAQQCLPSSQPSWQTAPLRHLLSAQVCHTAKCRAHASALVLPSGMRAQCGDSSGLLLSICHWLHHVNVIRCL